MIYFLHVVFGAPQTGFARFITSLLLLTCTLCASGTRAEPGVVVGSYSNQSNAQVAAQTARIELRNFGLDIRVKVLPVVDANAKSAFNQAFRVVLQPNPDLGARALLRRIRTLGFADAWYLADTEVAIAPEIVRPEQIAAPQLLTTVPQISQEVPRGGSPSTEPRIRKTSAGPQTVIGQEEGVDLHRVTIQTFAEKDVNLVIDGSVDEALWEQIPYYDNMLVSIPALKTPAEYETQIRLLATEKGLYVSSVMEQPPESLVKRYSRRDDFFDRDTFGVTIDASGEALVAYWFFVALGDSLSDGKVLPERRFARDWDGPWLGKSLATDSGWSVEFFLPWSMMNMPEVDGPRTIGFAAKRNISATNQSYGWPGYSQSSSRFVSALNELEVMGVQPRAQVSVIPFASATADEASGEVTSKVGVDVAWKPSPKIELSATANPDFGAVEADDVVLNLTASETFFPEKRLFFLEGNEVFTVMPRDDYQSIYRDAVNEDFATTSRQVYLRDYIPLPISLVNTRRIGGTANQVEVGDGVSPNRGQRDVPTDLIGAAKVTGAVGDYRYGVLGAIENDVSWSGSDTVGFPVEIESSGRDFAVARLTYENVGETRRSVGYMGTFVGGPLYDAVVHSIDGHYVGASGRLKADAQLIRSDRAELHGYGAVFDVTYSQTNGLRHKLEIDYMDEDVNFNDLGFLLRNNYGRARYALMFSRNKLTEKLYNFRSTLSVIQQYNIDRGQITDSSLLWRSSVMLPGRNTLRAGFGYLPERYEDIESRGNGAYRVEAGAWWEALLSTDAAKMFSFSAGLSSVREPLGGWSHSYKAGVTIRPFDAISMDLDLQYRDRNGWMVHQGGREFGRFHASEWQPSFDVNWFIAPGHQVRWNFQWAGVRAVENGFYSIPSGDGKLVEAARSLESYNFDLGLLTTQIRYRWEIAPLTDFYLVYNRGNAYNKSMGLNDPETDIVDLFSDSYADPIIDSFVAKLRYRFGN